MHKTTSGEKRKALLKKGLVLAVQTRTAMKAAGVLPQASHEAGDCSRAFLIGEACFDLVNVGCYRFEGHWTSAWTEIRQLDKMGQN